MRPLVCIVGDSPVPLWGLSSRERLRRQLDRLGVKRWLNGESVPEGESVLLLRADHLYDERVLAAIATTEGVLLERDDQPVPVAAHVRGELLSAARRSLLGQGAAHELPGVDVRTPQTVTTGYVRKLRKFEPGVVLPIDAEHRDVLERRLFDGSYKGVTDLVTKWIWPLPALWATRACARLGIRPNQVTSLSLVLALLVILLFAVGWLVLGLAVAWVMTFLDTVDGKLARVTVNSSTVGDYLDHGLDLIHPPLWYLAWGMGLSAFASPVSDLAWPEVFSALLIGYVGGRLLEAAFMHWLGHFSIFCWQPVDSCFRLVVARRNSNLILLSGSLLAGRPDWGLVAVAAWTILSALLLSVRLALAAWRRLTTGPLRCWLEDPHLGWARIPLAARPFVHPMACSRDKAVKSGPSGFSVR